MSYYLETDSFRLPPREEDVDNSRECDQCGFRPWLGWKSRKCPRRYDGHGSCDGRLEPAPAPAQPKDGGK